MSQGERSLVRNAADRAQVKFATQRVSTRERRRRDLLATQLSTVAGRAFVWSELERHGILDIVETTSAEVLFSVTGVRNTGLALYVECQAHVERFMEMQREALLAASREEREVDAAHVARVSGTQE